MASAIIDEDKRRKHRAECLRRVLAESYLSGKLEPRELEPLLKEHPETEAGERNVL